jgi:hypothetical protein
MTRGSLSLYLFLTLLVARSPLSFAQASIASEVLNVAGELSHETPQQDYPLDIKTPSTVTIAVHQKDSGMVLVPYARLRDALEEVEPFSVKSAEGLHPPWWQILKYVVSPGHYIIRVYSNGWSITQTISFTISVTTTKLSESPAPGKAIEGWIRENGLGDILTLRGYYAFESLSTGQHLGTLFPYSPPEKTAQALSTIINLIKSGDSHKNGIQFMQLARHPHILLEFQSPEDRSSFFRFRQSFHDIYGYALDDKLINVAAGFAYTSRLNFALLIQGSCWDSTHIAAAQGEGFNGGGQCDHASAATVLPVPASIVALEKTSLPGLSAKHMDKIDEFLKSYFSAKNGAVTVLESTPRYIELLVRNLKGEIIHGGNQWERLSLAVSVTPLDQNNEEVRAIADGFLASGFSYPPDESFTQSMEPAHSRDLQDYTRAMISQIGNAVKGDGGK